MTGTTPAISPMQLRSARLLLGWSFDRLAPQLDVSTTTLRHIEQGKLAGHEDVRIRARALFENVGFEFTDDGPPGLRLRPAHFQPVADARC